MQPNASHDLQFDAPIERWDEALPLGNGLLGGLVWGDGAPLRVSLDRADLWDLRPVPEWESRDYNYATMRRWVAEGRIGDLQRLYERPYSEYPGPTKIPAGRLEIGLPPGGRVMRSRLHLGAAMAAVELADGRRLELFLHATEPIGWMRLLGGGEAPELRVVPPRYAGDRPGADAAAHSSGDLVSLSYGAPDARDDGPWCGFVQTGWGGFRYAVGAAWRKTAGGVWETVWTVATNRDGADPWRIATDRIEAAFTRGWEALRATHAAWWAAHWSRSSVRLPNPTLERQWCLETYKFGAAARRGAPPITLQAVWTADDGRIPPWKGDYHHDLNTQLSYWPCYSGNRLEGGLGFLDWLWETRPEAYAYTRCFWGLPGLNVPMTADLAGRQIGGWHQYTHSATTGAWLAHHFYLHWRYSRDRAFLAERAYPYLADVCTFLEAVTEVDAQGRRYLPLSSSPEIHDNRLEAWLPPTSNYDLALIRWAFGAAAELAGEIGDSAAASRWEAALATCPDFSFGPDGRLLVAPGEALAESHRHFSHLMAIHPLGLITWEAGERARQTIQAALAELDRLGPDWWCGYSYAWLAHFAARAKDGEKAERALAIFARAFCTANGFHVNGDQTRSGYSRFTYRPFTLEGNFAAGAGIQEMLLQSYGGVIRVFPAVPAAWKDVEFKTLRAEGAFLVSAQREEGVTTHVEIEAETGGTLVLADPFDGAAARLTVSGAAAPSFKRTGGLITAEVPAGTVLSWARRIR